MSVESGTSVVLIKFRLAQPNFIYTVYILYIYIIYIYEVRGARDGGFFQRLRPPLGPRQHSMGLVGPASWPDGRLAGAVLVRTAGPAARAFGGTRSLNAPFLDPRGHQRACTGKRPVSRGEAQPAYNSGGDEAPFTSGVCLITRRQTWLLQRPSSLTHPLPSGAW